MPTTPPIPFLLFFFFLFISFLIKKRQLKRKLKPKEINTTRELSGEELNFILEEFEIELKIFHLNILLIVILFFNLLFLFILFF